MPCVPVVCVLQVHPELPALPEQHDGRGLHAGSRCRLPPGAGWIPHRARALPLRLPGRGGQRREAAGGGMVLGTAMGLGRLEGEFWVQPWDGDGWRRSCWRWNHGVGTAGRGITKDTTMGWGQLERERLEMEPRDGDSWKGSGCGYSWKGNDGGCRYGMRTAGGGMVGDRTRGWGQLEGE